MGRIRPLPPLVPDSAMSPEALKLKKFHDDFVMRHSSPMREKFVYEFGRNCAGPASWMPVPPVMKEQLPSPSLRTIDPNQRFESTNQSHYMRTSTYFESPFTVPIKIVALAFDLRSAESHVDGSRLAVAAYTEALKIPSFRPEVKHRNLKTES